MLEGNGSNHEVTWTDESHGSITVRLESPYHHVGFPLDGVEYYVELYVGYLRDVVPALFLEGTLPAPDMDNMLFPWCVDSGHCRLTAPERIKVITCPFAEVPDEGGVCARCPTGKTLFLGTCRWNTALLWGTVGAFALMLASFLTLAAQVEVEGLRTLSLDLRTLSLDLLSRRIHIHDVSREGGRVLLTTHGRHHLHLGLAKSFRVRFAKTGHPHLDSPKELFRARVVQPDQLELLDARGEALPGRLETSQGFVRLPLRRIALHTGWPVPVALSAPVLLVAASCWLGLLCQRGGSGSELGQVPAWWAPLVVGTSLAASVAVLLLRRSRCAPTPLERRRGAYAGRRSGGSPKPVNRGAERAITAAQLTDLHDHFQEFVRDRDMYYVVANIVIPLTAVARLSFAEYVGPSRLSWFASHFWGTGFRHFCESIRRHAESEGDWERQSYWICSFSINQHAVETEIGADHRDSSFYLALQSATYRGTCMVVDEQALPLTRSWCLFELLQTIVLEQKGAAGYTGLFFCTSSGVLNSGRASVETSLGLGRRLATLKLEEADASVASDKVMIDSLVVNTMGGFDAMNHALRGRISAALRASKETAVRDFELLEQALTA